MDRLIKRWNAAPDDDLMVCERHGVAYQRNMGRGRIDYDGAYFDHYRSLAGSAIERALNSGRTSGLAHHAPDWDDERTRRKAKVLDVGIGNGSFIDAARACGFEAKGLDVNPVALDWLRERDLLAESVRGFDVVTFWDSLEHMEAPEKTLRRIDRGALVLVAVPLVEDLRQVRASKHFKPGEHLYYWTAEGFVAWMALYGFRLLERSEHEVEAGRESIGAFAFRRDLPGYDEYIEAYRELHSSKHYGSSATELHLDLIADVVRANRPKSILDFGCGRSDLASHFYLDGARRIARYDPAIPLFRDMPEGRFDLALCCDVLEHIPMAAVDRVLEQVKEKSDIAVFTISMKLAKARLPDGSNAHCTLLTRSEWEGWLKDVFGAITILPTRAEHECNILVGKTAKVSRRKLSEAA